MQEHLKLQSWCEGFCSNLSVSVFLANTEKNQPFNWITLDYFVAISVTGCYDLNNGGNKHKDNCDNCYIASKSDH